jgi:hypothetical protein
VYQDRKTNKDEEKKREDRRIYGTGRENEKLYIYFIFMYLLWLAQTLVCRMVKGKAVPVTGHVGP